MVVERELDNLKNFDYVLMDLRSKDFDYVVMTNRTSHQEQDTGSNIKSCYEIYSGKDIVKVERNGLILSTIRESR